MAGRCGQCRPPLAGGGRAAASPRGGLNPRGAVLGHPDPDAFCRMVTLPMLLASPGIPRLQSRRDRCAWGRTCRWDRGAGTATWGPALARGHRSFAIAGGQEVEVGRMQGNRKMVEGWGSAALAAPLGAGY